ncbi:putative secreted lipase [Psilocybe cubensis]|uniref:Carboxylic ester hydrolase n=2 Tax=Psilocybe cubensis TaxID=181762 RepID=A0A8H8CR02_PSICU|nr:putative secreted lipase [Psilocybe cubensis]KAH9486198.1 putative secreted lipase [Psilocybe cubensis]
MVISGIVCLSLLQYAAAAILGRTAGPVVDLGYAKYQGLVVEDAVSNATRTHFLGIRFAAPPTGLARFNAPSLPSTVPGIQQANAQPPMCLQSPYGSAPTNPYRVDKSQDVHKRDESTSSEDCLFLNVYIPGNVKKSSKLPVVVWIHGGGYVLGSISETGYGGEYDGDSILRQSQDSVILVSIQYRLGLFGFLAGQKVKEGGALNAGLLDQQFALKWVQTYIERFGGDPRKVTIWGQSAGAGSVLQHVIANGGRTNPPLFRGAITSSTFLPSQYRYNDRIPQAIYNETVTRAGCSSSADTLNCLRLADVNVLQAANVAINTAGFFGTFVFVPVVDGTFIQGRPTQLLKQKKVNGDQLYSVVNTFEGTIFIDPSTENTVQVAQYISQLFPTLESKNAQAAAMQYAGLGSNFAQVISIMGEAIFVCPTYYLQTSFGGKGYKGLFAIPPGNHGTDLIYYFPGSVSPGGDLPFSNPDFIKAFTQTFPDFVTSLNPNKKRESDITPPWSPWGGSNEMLFNQTEAGAPDVRPIKSSKALLERCRFWESVGSLTGQ